MLSKLKNKIFTLSKHPHAELYFFILCFIEAFMLPIPTTVMQAPMTLARPERTMRFVWISSAASIIGGIVGYCLGRLFFSLIENYVMHSSHSHEFLAIQHWVIRWGVFTIFPLALCPIPFKITTISAGLLGVHFVPFLVMICAARFLHFFIIGYIILHGQRRFSKWVLKRYGSA